MRCWHPVQVRKAPCTVLSWRELANHRYRKLAFALIQQVVSAAGLARGTQVLLSQIQGVSFMATGLRRCSYSLD
jgi:hypothetical protein